MEHSTAMNYKAFKKNLESYIGLIADKKSLDEEIEYLYYELANVKGVRYDKAPSIPNQEQIDKNKLEIIEKINIKESRLKYINQRIDKINEEISLLSKECQKICNMNKMGMSFEKIGYKLGYTKVGAYLKLKREVERL